MLADREFFALPTATQQIELDKDCQQSPIPEIAQLAHHRPPRIAHEDISVVIQGPIFTQTHALAPNGITEQVITALRQHLPDATLILATWAGQPLEQISQGLLDKVLTLPDPGATSFYPPGTQTDNLYNNCNRLIYSTQQGLHAVTTRYVLKIRSDLLLFHPRFSDFFGVFDKFDPQWQLLQQRILSFPMFSIKFEQGKNAKGELVQQPRPFHVSDWAYFGLTADMQQLFACPLVPEPQTSRWFETRPKPDNDIWAQRLWRYSPEQYITANLALRGLGIQLEHASQADAAIVDASARVIANNFVILDQKLWGMWSLKLQHYQDELKNFIPAGLYTLAVWYEDYKKYSG